MKDSRYILTETQTRILEFCRKLKPEAPPNPWTRHTTFGAAGVFAGGWMGEDNFIMLSTSGYSKLNFKTGEQIFFNTDVERMYGNLDVHEKNFQMPKTKELIQIFGIRSGDGIHITTDWKIRVIHPWWPNSTVLLYKSNLLNEESMYVIDSGVCDPGNWIKVGFSPTEKSFVILGHGGAEFYSVTT